MPTLKQACDAWMEEDQNAPDIQTGISLLSAILRSTGDDEADMPVFRAATRLRSVYLERGGDPDGSYTADLVHEIKRRF